MVLLRVVVQGSDKKKWKYQILDFVYAQDDYNTIKSYYFHLHFNLSI